MAARESYYAESLAEQTTTSTSAQDALSYTLTPTAGKSYFLIATAEVNCTTTSVKVNASFLNSSDSVTYNSAVMGAGNTSNYFTFAGATKYTDDGSGTAKTFKIQFNSGTSGTTVKIKNCRLCIIEVGTNDQYFENLTPTSTGSGGINTINSSFTPPSIGDYTLIWVSDVHGTTTTSRCETSIIVGATTYDQNARQPRTANTDIYTQCGVIGLASLTASSQAVKMNFIMSSNVTGTIQNAKMIFLRHDGFDDAHFVYQGTAQARTNTAYGDVTGGSLTFTPAADKYLFLGGCLQWGSSTSALVGTQLLEDSTTMLETLQTVDTTTERNNFLTAWIETPTNASHTYKYQFKSSISSANFQYGTISALKVGTASGDMEADPTGVSSTGVAGSPTINAAANVTPTGASATGAVGTPTVNLLITANPTGVSSTGAAGSPSITGDANVTPTGVTATGAAGTPTVDLLLQVFPSGVSATGAAGNVSIAADANVTPSGVSATGAAGTLTITGDASLTAAGAAATGMAGAATATIDITASPSGVAATGNAGNVTVDSGSGATEADPAGVAATGAAGAPSIAGDAIINAAGISANAAAGSPSISGDAAVSVAGVASIGHAGAAAAKADVSVTVSGVAVTGAAGNVSAAGGANALPAGIAATGQAGSLSVTGDSALIAPGIAASGQAGDIVIDIIQFIDAPPRLLKVPPHQAAGSVAAKQENFSAVAHAAARNTAAESRAFRVPVKENF